MLKYAEANTEMALLFACGQSAANDASLDRIRTLLGAPIDWDLLLSLAHRHHLIPLLSLHLQRIGPRDIPPDFLARLHNANFRNSRHNLFIIQQLLQILQALKQEGVSAVPIKGPVLAQQVFGSISLRSYLDIDLLIAKADLERAMETLRRLDFCEQETHSAKGKAVHREIYYECTMTNSDTSLDVELHHRLDWPCCETTHDVSAIMNRSRTMSLYGVDVQTLTLEDQILYLAFHGAKHLWSRLEWLCCLAQIIQGRHTDVPVDWAIVEMRTRQRGYRHIVSVALLMAKHVFGASIPPEMAPLVCSDRLARRMSMELFNRSFVAQADATSVDDFMYAVRFRDSIHDRMRYFWMRTTTPTNIDLEGAPAQLHLLLPVIRPLRIAGEAAQRLAIRLLQRVINSEELKRT